ncbi:MAG: hypothetical protein H6Q74_1475 [Firmicutes bacterium]|nr:hypothetical protein [Bacillota bacterium]
MDEIVETVDKWTFMESLPKTWAGFTLGVEKNQLGEQYNIFSYSNNEKRRSLSLLYDNLTKDYLVRIKVGMTEYYDINYIVGNLEALEETLKTRLEDTLNELGGKQHYESIFREKQILEWPYIAKLPAKAVGFELFISPSQAVKMINGSYIVLDYSDFSAASNLIIYYNVFRDEFFGELRPKMTPMMTVLFDARQLDDLANKLENNLVPELESLRRMISADSEE